MRSASDAAFMQLALRLARRGYGRTSPNPMVGAVLVKGGRVIGSGWHHRAGEPHAEIEALRDAEKRGHKPAGATLYVTLEPCCTFGRTPPCTEAIIRSRIRRVVIGAVDPNPAHEGKGLRQLLAAGIRVDAGVLADEAAQLNEAFNHWIVKRTPFVTVKAAMSLDGKIATAAGESKWITGLRARAVGQRLRQGADAILVGVNTILRDDPTLTARNAAGRLTNPRLRRLVLDSQARTPLTSRVITDEYASLTTIIVTPQAPQRRREALARKVQVLEAPARDGHVDLRWLMKTLGQQQVTSLLVEGGGEVNARFLLNGLAHRIVFFYAPMIIGGRDAIKGVAGPGAPRKAQGLPLTNIQWRRLGPDLWLSALVANK